MPTCSFDAIADWYAAWVNESALAADPIFTVTRPLLGPVAGRHLCDLACGEGRITRALAAEGATVVGIDQSANLIAHARRATPAPQPGITYRVASAVDRPGIPDASFDGVLCHMALMDIADLEATLGTVARVLVPGGWFVGSILHPCFHTATAGEVATGESGGVALGPRRLLPYRHGGGGRNAGGVETHGRQLLRRRLVAVGGTTGSAWEGRGLSPHARDLSQRGRDRGSCSGAARETAADGKRRHATAGLGRGAGRPNRAMAKAVIPTRVVKVPTVAQPAGSEAQRGCHVGQRSYSYPVAPSHPRPSV